MNIDYTKIITNDLKTLITEDRLMVIKDEATKESKFIRRNGLTDFVKEHLFQKADEIAYTRTQHKNKTDVEKAILAANIALDDDNTVEALLKGNFDKETLKLYIALVDYVKRKKMNNSEIDSKYTDAVKVFTKKLVKHFSNIFVGNPTPNIIINKINELLSFKPELLEVKNNHRAR